MQTIELKPCPFCPGGGEPFADAHVHGWEIFARVGCRECGIGFDADGLTGRGRDAQADADALLPPLVEKWNRRPVMQGEVEFAVQYFDGARWEMETNSFVNAEFARANEEAARGCMAHLAARYPAVKYRLVSRQVGDWEPMDEEGGQ